MEFLECKICNFQYDEDDHRPRQIPCGHGLCSACLRALIKDRIFECPKCRQKIKVDIPDNLPANYDLIEVIRAFNAQGFTFGKVKETRSFGATNDELCNIHCKSISHWCHTCQIWICVGCLGDHPISLGCSTAIITDAIKTIKDEHIGSLDTLVTKFEDDAKQVSLKIQEHADKKQELLKKIEIHNEELKKLQDKLDKGNIHKENLLESRKHLNEASSRNAVGDCIKLVTQRKQILRSWSNRNLGGDTQVDFREALKEDKNVYVECVVKDKKLHGKLLLYRERIYFHKLMAQTPTKGCITVPYTDLQKMIPAAISLVFLEISLGGAIKGQVLLKLDEKLPNIRENMVTIATGMAGKSLAGMKCDRLRTDLNCFYNFGLPFSDISVTPDRKGGATANKGDVIGFYSNDYLQQIMFCVGTYNWPSNYVLIGSIVDGMDIIQECYDNHSRGVLINDCGIVLDQ